MSDPTCHTDPPRLTKAGTPWRGHLRGFASLSPEARRQIAAAGGRAAHRSGRAHRWTRETARHAGRIGGKVGGKGRRRLREAPAEAA